MADKENQHYVPQYYFRFFSNNGKSISLINKSTGKLVTTASIKGQASKSYFYGDKVVEDSITKLESCFLAPLKKLKDCKSFASLDDSEVILILQSIMFQRSRTLATRLDRRDQSQHIANLFLEIAINNCEDLSDEIKQQLRESTTVVPDAKEFQKIEIIESVSNAHFLFDLGRAILKNRTNKPFIFGDAPVVFSNPFQQNICSRGVLGMRNPGLIIFFPLSPRTAIFLYDRNVYKVKPNKNGNIDVRHAKDIDQLNSLQLHSAASAAYFDDIENANYVHDLWKNACKKEFKTKGIIRTFVVQHEEENKEILHQFDEQLSFIPSLSFAACPKLATSDFLIDRDSWDGRNYQPEQREWFMPTGS